MTTNDKHKKFMADARAFAENHSKDRSTKVGALILGPDNEPLSWGFNGFPRGADDDKEERHERPLKYQFTEHAERNAIYNAARSGIRLLGSRIYVTNLPCCVDCARAIVQSGIKEVYMEASAFDDSNPRAAAWKESTDLAKEILEECGVEYFVLS
jgi:dCMP deaminase